jgi:hypothetical protein
MLRYLRSYQMRFVLICVWLVLGVCVHSAAAQSAEPDPVANPGRPTVSTPATLTPTGYLQFETGTIAANHSPEFSSQYGLNEFIKFSVASRLEFLASAGPVAHSRSDGSSGNYAGDVFLGAQGVILPGEGSKPTIAASYFHKVYAGAAPDFDLGSPTNAFLLLASADVKGFHYDANAFFNEIVQEPVRRAQFGQTLSISHHLVGNFALSGEIWHFTQPFLRGRAVGNLWAVSYTARKTLVLDAGFNRGLTSTSTRWEAFIGCTYLLPHRLFGK